MIGKPIVPREQESVYAHQPASCERLNALLGGIEPAGATLLAYQACRRLARAEWHARHPRVDAGARARLDPDRRRLERTFDQKVTRYLS